MHQMDESSLKSDSETISASGAVATPAAPAPPAAGPSRPVSDWSPLLHPTFRALWLASAVSYTGFETRNYAAPLLMGNFCDLYKLPAGMVSYTQTASLLPILLFVLFAGALADRVDRRKLLIVTHLWMMLAAGVLGVLTICHFMNAWPLLIFLFAIGAGYAMMSPVLLAVLPELVEPRELKSAMALNSVNMNIARVAGPLIGGLIIYLIANKENFYLGKGCAFLATALSLVGVVYVMAKWKPAARKTAAPSETMLAAVWIGVSYTFSSPRLLAIMARIFLFMVCAGILPYYCARICQQNADALWGETGASIMMAFFGGGAILGVYLMQPLQRKFGVEPDRFDLRTVLYGLPRQCWAYAWMPKAGDRLRAMRHHAGFNWVIVPTTPSISPRSWPSRLGSKAAQWECTPSCFGGRWRLAPQSSELRPAESGCAGRCSLPASVSSSARFLSFGWRLV